MATNAQRDGRILTQGTWDQRRPWCSDHSSQQAYNSCRFLRVRLSATPATEVRLTPRETTSSSASLHRPCSASAPRSAHCARNDAVVTGSTGAAQPAALIPQHIKLFTVRTKHRKLISKLKPRAAEMWNPQKPTKTHINPSKTEISNAAISMNLNSRKWPINVNPIRQRFNWVMAFTGYW
jgi:hypothetical protein